MGGRTLKTQVALYLDADKVEMLDQLAKKTGKTKQEILREALDAVLIEHKLMKGPKHAP